MNKTNKRHIYFAGIFITGITLISLLFHYPVHIADALTLGTLPEYEIHISVWRILFEPVLGVLLFFNRAFYAISEFQLILVWILIIFIVHSIFKSISIKDKPAKKKFIISQLINLPLVIGLWFTVFVIIIFIPLPNNTIINNSTNSVLVTTHSHTEYSHDGLISQENQWKWHKRNGFDAFFITEHNNHDKTLDFVNAQRNNEFPMEPLVLCGEEFSGTNHLSLLGLKRRFNTSGYSDSTAIDSVRASNGAVIVNHWFDDENMSLEYYKDLGVDGFEIENSATDRTYDRKIYQNIKEFCQNNNLILNGGLDFHGYGNACSIWNAFEIPDWHNLSPESKEESIINIFRTRDQDKLKVLLYKDRPYYNKKYLFLSPLFTVINYFRTLNFYQLISWICWILLFTIIKILAKKEFKKQIAPNRLIPVMGILSALFMVGLGVVYLGRIKDIAGFTEMYVEYSTLLFVIGSVFLIYSAIIVFIRIFKSKSI